MADTSGFVNFIESLGSLFDNSEVVALAVAQVYWITFFTLLLAIFKKMLSLGSAYERGQGITLVDFLLRMVLYYFLSVLIIALFLSPDGFRVAMDYFYQNLFQTKHPFDYYFLKAVGLLNP